MITATVIFYLVVLGLTGVAIYIQLTTSKLSLPISSSTTISVILLPWISALANYTSRLIASTTTTTTTAGKSGGQNGPWPSAPLRRLAAILLPTLHIFQSILTVILLTLLSQTLTPGDISDCRVTTRWQSLWTAHDRRSIETIQDQFDCCGFNSVRDRAWPRDTCTSLYGRTRACRADWDAALRRTSGLGLGICIVVLGFQVYQFARFTGARNLWVEERRERGYKRIAQGGSGGDHEEDEGRHRMIVDVSDDDHDDDHVGGRGVESSRLLEEGGAGDQDPVRESGGARNGYGAVEDQRGVAVMPSGLGQEDNHWR